MNHFKTDLQFTEKSKIVMHEECNRKEKENTTFQKHLNDLLLSFAPMHTWKYIYVECNYGNFVHTHTY